MRKSILLIPVLLTLFLMPSVASYEWYETWSCSVSGGGAGASGTCSPIARTIAPCSSDVIVKAYLFPEDHDCTGCETEPFVMWNCIWDTQGGTKLSPVPPPSGDCAGTSMGCSASIGASHVYRTKNVFAPGTEVDSQGQVIPASCQQDGIYQYTIHLYCGDWRYEPCDLYRGADPEYRCYGDWEQRCVSGFYADNRLCAGGCEELSGRCVVCTEGWLDEYQCVGDWRQRKYQLTDCSTEWRNYEYCDFGCSAGVCQSATPTDCMTITHSGSYSLAGNIDANLGGVACIVIDADDVTFDLNGYTINDVSGTQYGVYAYSGHSNIVVRNGEIKGFHNGAVRFEQINGGTIEYITSSLQDYGIRLTGAMNQNINVLNNNIVAIGGTGIMGACYTNCRIAFNTIEATTGIFLNGFGFTVEDNDIGTWSGETATPPCERSEVPVRKGIECDFCSDSTIKKNYIIVEDNYGPAIEVKNSASGNRIVFNDFEMDKAFALPGTFSSDTENNTWCDNRMIDVTLQISETECVWMKPAENSASYVVDQGVNNTISPFCEEECIAGYVCRDSHLVYLNENCDVVEEYECEYGCVEGDCVGERLPYPPPVTTMPTPTARYNISWWEPVVNETEFRQANAQWMIPFFTPFFLALVGLFSISGIFAFFTKSGLIGALVFLALVLVYVLIGIFDIWVGIILAVLSAMIVAWQVKGMIS